MSVKLYPSHFFQRSEFGHNIIVSGEKSILRVFGSCAVFLRFFQCMSFLDEHDLIIIVVSDRNSRKNSVNMSNL